MNIDELTNESKMIRDYGECFMFYDHTHTLDGMKYTDIREAIPQYINTLGNVDGIQLSDKYGRIAIVSRSTRHVGKWQTSYIDAKGPYADTVRDTMSDGMIAAVECGFTTINEVI